MEITLQEPTAAQHDEFSQKDYPLLGIAELGEQPLNYDPHPDFGGNDGGKLTILLYPDCLVLSYDIHSYVPWDPDARQFVLDCTSKAQAMEILARIDLSTATSKGLKALGFREELV